MESSSSLVPPNSPNRERINQQLEGSPSSSSSPIHESDPLLIPDFSNDLAIEILSRLPAKSLGKFKCVSKPWLSLISSPAFIKTHLEMASGRDDFGHHHLIVYKWPSDDKLRPERLSVCSLLQAPNPEISTAEGLNIDYPFRTISWWDIVGSCNGLVCIFYRKSRCLFFCNPCLKKFKKLPDAGMRCDWGKFGFGYDKSNDDYKVVGLCESRKGSPSESKLEFKIIVYSLKNDSWRQMEDLKIGISRFSYNLEYASGKFHWCVIGVNHVWKIASYDLATETCREIEPPPDDKRFIDWQIGELGGCLSVFYEYQRSHADIWIMRVLLLIFLLKMIL